MFRREAGCTAAPLLLGWGWLRLCGGQVPLRPQREPGHRELGRAQRIPAPQTASLPRTPVKGRSHGGRDGVSAKGLRGNEGRSGPG